MKPLNKWNKSLKLKTEYHCPIVSTVWCDVVADAYALVFIIELVGFVSGGVFKAIECRGSKTVGVKACAHKDVFAVVAILADAGVAEVSDDLD